MFDRFRDADLTPPASSLEVRLSALQNAAAALLDTEPARALDLAREGARLAKDAGAPGMVARFRTLAGRAFQSSGDLPAALESLEAAVRLHDELGDALGQAGAAELAGKVCLNLGRLEEAEQHLRSAIRLADAEHSVRAEAILATALNHLAGVQHTQGESLGALASLRQALGIWERQQQFSGQAHCLSNIGNIQTSLGQYPEAVSHLSRAYGLYHQHLKDARSEAFILNNLARVHHLSGDTALAVEVMRSALVASEASQDAVVQATSLLNLGTFCMEGEQHDEALAHLEEALSLSRKTGYRTGELSTLDSLGSYYERRGEPDRAARAHQQALDIALDIGDVEGELDARLHLGKLNMAAGTRGAAFEQLNAALELASQTRSPRHEADIHQALAEGYQEENQFERALGHFIQLRKIEKDLFDAERDRQTRNLTLQFEVERARHDADVYKIRTEVEQEGRRAAEQLVQERTSELARAQHEVVTRLAMAAEYRDDTTGEHTRRVGRASARIARALGWSEKRAGILGIAARLHDVGKIGIPDTVLLKPGKLDPDQFSQMQTHTLIGARILSGGRSELLRLAEEIALTHHERWDGQGYPRGLTAEQIPLSGRIVAVADVFDALTQVRPYKRAWTPLEAMREIIQQAGQHFDPHVVETALAVLTTPDPQAPDESGDLLTDGSFPDDLPLAEEDASHVLAVFEQLLVERTRELDLARFEAEQTAQHMQRMALTDSMTGLSNRRAFEADLEDAFSAVRAGERSTLAVMSFDLDGLKVINDSCGHDGGDNVLQAFGQGLAAEFSAIGQAYRIGGDEFAVIGTGVPSDGRLATSLETVLRRVREAGFPEAGASWGVARYPEDAETAGDLLRLSDRRMYQNKLERRVGR